MDFAGTKQKRVLRYFTSPPSLVHYGNRMDKVAVNWTKPHNKSNTMN